MSYSYNTNSQQVGVIDLYISLGFVAAYAAILALVGWPMGEASIALSFLKGTLLLVAVTVVIFGLDYFFCDYLRLDPHSRSGVTLILRIIAVLALTIAWIAFLATEIETRAADLSTLSAVVLGAVGLIGGYLGFALITELFYKGSLYKMVSLPTSTIGYLIVLLTGLGPPLHEVLLGLIWW